MSWLARAMLSGGHFAVLNYHRVLAAKDAFRLGEPDVHQFEAQVRWLARHFNCLTFAAAMGRLADGRGLPRGTVVVTFDDGYLDNLTLAVPVLARHGVPATVFVATGMLADGVMWNDRIIEAFRTTAAKELPAGLGGNVDVVALPDPAAKVATCHAVIHGLKPLAAAARLAAVERVEQALQVAAAPRLMLDVAGVQAISAAGFEIGGHTVNHPILTSLDAATAAREIHGCREDLINMVQDNVVSFAYPNGRPGLDWTEEHAAMVAAAGFTAAVSTRWGAARMDDDVWAIPRVGLADATGLRLLRRAVGAFRG